MQRFYRNCKHQRKFSAFTLIELLVVIFIISVLLGILLPSLFGARNQAKSLVCLTNLQSLGYQFQVILREPGSLKRFSPDKWNEQSFAISSFASKLYSAGAYYSSSEATQNVTSRDSVILCPAVSSEVVVVNGIRLGLPSGTSPNPISPEVNIGIGFNSRLGLVDRYFPELSSEQTFWVTLNDNFMNNQYANRMPLAVDVDAQEAVSKALMPHYIAPAITTTWGTTYTFRDTWFPAYRHHMGMANAVKLDGSVLRTRNLLDSSELMWADALYDSANDKTMLESYYSVDILIPANASDEPQ